MHKSKLVELIKLVAKMVIIVIELLVLLM